MARPRRPDARGVPTPSGPVELHIHGVGGAPPEDILEVSATCLVAGDESAGFFRPRHLDETPDARREAYSWGGLTSASRLRALWVLLAPFAIANLAGWMLRHGGEPTDTDPRRRLPTEEVGVAVIRIFGLILSVSLASYVALATSDLIGFQCGGDPSCADRWWLLPWAALGGDANRSVALGLVVAVGVVLLVAWMARRSQIALHSELPVDFAAADDPAMRVNLTQAALWQSPQVAHRLGLTHTAGALTAIALTAAVPGSQVGDLGESAPVPGWIILAVTALVLVRLEGVTSWVHIGLVALSAGYLLLVTAALWNGDGLAGVDGRLPGADSLTVVSFPVWALATFVVVVVVAILWRSNPHGSLRSAMVAPGLLAGAAGMVAAFGSGFLIRLADLLGWATPVSDREPAPVRREIVFADWVGDIAVVTVFALVVLLVSIGVVWFRVTPARDCSELAIRYAERGGLDCDDEGDREWANQVGRAEAVARVTDRAAAVVGMAVVVVLVALALAVALSDDPSGMGLGSWVEPLIGPASLVLGILPVVAVVMIARLYRSRAIRRVVGILWDVATFWPRFFHPWSPPSYGEKAVPQLGERLATLSAGGGIVISAHSQGSVLAVATLCLAEPSVRERTGLLTHGSPLTRLYAPYFPEYLSVELYSALAGRLRGWINLWRPTDFIGGELATPGVDDREVFDPPASRPAAPGQPRPAPFRHSDYEKTDEYAQARAELWSGIDGA